MKTQTIKLMMIIFILFLAWNADAQTTVQKTGVKSKSTKSKSSASNHTAKGAPVAVTVILNSKCEKSLMIFSGPKENLHNPKQRQVGGLSVNNLYLKTGDVVCIMDAKKKPTSCVNITKATAKLEINEAGTAIVAP